MRSVTLDGKEGTEAFVPAPERADLAEKVAIEAATFIMFHARTDPNAARLRQAVTAWWKVAVREIPDDTSHVGEYVDGGEFGQVWECAEHCPSPEHDEIGD